MADQPARTPRSAPRLIAETLQLYRRYPLLFLLLAAGVVVPFELIVLAVTGTGPFNRRSLNFGTSFPLFLIQMVVIDSLVSALHVHAVAEVEEGRIPQASAVTRRGLAALPAVASATIVGSLAVFGGTILLVIPGIYLYLRLRVVAQVAAIERKSWMAALGRSRSLTEKNLLHVLFFSVLVLAVGLLSFFLIDRPFAHHHTTVALFLLGVAVQVLVLSFTALSSALLYYDLRARREILAGSRSAEGPDLPEPTPERPDRHFDPRLEPRTPEEVRRTRRGLPG